MGIGQIAQPASLPSPVQQQIAQAAPATIRNRLRRNRAVVYRVARARD